MSTATPVTIQRPKTVAELIERLGDVPPDRIRMEPTPGTATEADLVRNSSLRQGLCELVDGVLVEKAVGYYESCLAMLLVEYLGTFLRAEDLGFVVGPDGATRFGPGLIRLPDVSVVRWERLPERRIPRDAIGGVIPDLAVEFLSRGNTKAEIEGKLGECLRAGVALVWIVDPRHRTVEVHRPGQGKILLQEDDVLDGGDVLPGFRVSIREWFDHDASVQREKR